MEEMKLLTISTMATMTGVSQRYMETRGYVSCQDIDLYLEYIWFEW